MGDRFARGLAIAASSASVLTFGASVWRAISTHQLKSGLGGFFVAAIVFAAIAVTSFYYHTFYLRHPFADLRTCYTIKILNAAGDATIALKTLTSICVLPPVSQRRHVAFSDGAPMNWSDIKIRAWDSENHNLQCELVKDGKTEKSFNVKFFRPVRWPKKLEYTYEYQWNSAFRPADVFAASDVCKDVTIHVILPQPFELKNLTGKEIFPDGHENTLIPLDHEPGQGGLAPSAGEKVFTFAFRKQHRDTTLRTELEWG